MSVVNIYSLILFIVVNKQMYKNYLKIILMVAKKLVNVKTVGVLLPKVKEKKLVICDMLQKYENN